MVLMVLRGQCGTAPVKDTRGSFDIGTWTILSSSCCWKLQPDIQICFPFLYYYFLFIFYYYYYYYYFFKVCLCALWQMFVCTLVMWYQSHRKKSDRKKHNPPQKSLAAGTLFSVNDDRWVKQISQLWRAGLQKCSKILKPSQNYYSNIIRRRYEVAAYMNFAIITFFHIL
jgi:hypothetical protein